MSETPDSCSSCDAPGSETQAVSSTGGAGLAFKIEGMDCAEEVAILKRALSSHVEPDELGFDVLIGRMTVPAGTDANVVMNRRRGDRNERRRLG